MTQHTIAGLILAGGLGSRLGGQDKGLVEVGNKTMISHVIERFSPQVSRLAISANRSLDIYANYGYELLSDDTEEFLGPLAGICKGLSWCPADLLAVVPCDSPRLPLNFVSAVYQEIKSTGRSIGMASAGGYRQPVFAVIDKTLHASLQSFLDAGERKIGKWFESHNAIEVEFDDITAFANINTEHDRQSLELEIQ